jgi:hypothetical protein
MEGLILTAGTPGGIPWGTLSWGTALMALTIGAIPLGLAVRNTLRGRGQASVVRLGLITGGKTLRPHAA